jgi:hypothetical protein
LFLVQYKYLLQKLNLDGFFPNYCLTEICWCSRRTSDSVPTSILASSPSWDKPTSHVKLLGSRGEKSARIQPWLQALLCILRGRRRAIMQRPGYCVRELRKTLAFQIIILSYTYYGWYKRALTSFLRPHSQVCINRRTIDTFLHHFFIGRDDQRIIFSSFCLSSPTQIKKKRRLAFFTVALIFSYHSSP